MFTEPTQWIALALALLGGWLLGLASHPGGRRWRERYEAERHAHAAFREESNGLANVRDARVRELEAAHERHAASDARIAELERDRAALAQANARIAELERERASLGQASARVAELERERAGFAQANARITELERENARLREAASRPAAAERPPLPLNRRVITADGRKRGWFDWGPGADPRAHPNG